MHTNLKDIATIIVLYNPSNKCLERWSSKLDNDKLNIIFVDNSAVVNNDILKLSLEYKNITYIANKENLGIAAAQNIGINIAQDLKLKYIVFFDQDSAIELSYISQIANVFEQYSIKIPQLGILGPLIYSEKTGKEYASIFYDHSVDNDGFIQKPNIISSGSCIKLSIFETIGYLDEVLFIDNVDSEICWRATKYGYKVGLTNKLKLYHNIGESQLKLGRYRVNISAPFRYFYQCRNYMWLIRRSYVPVRWKINMGIKIFARTLYFPFLLKNGIIIDKYIIKGIFKGLFSSPNKIIR